MMVDEDGDQPEASGGGEITEGELDGESSPNVARICMLGDDGRELGGVGDYPKSPEDAECKDYG